MNENKKIIIYIIVFIVILVGASVLYKALSKSGEETVQNKLNDVTTEMQNKIEETNNNKDSISFNIYKENGEKVSIENFKGKPIVINFWTSWCYYCKQEMKDFQELYNEQKDNVNFIMLNVPDGVQETRESAVQFIEDNKYTFPVYFDMEYNGITMFQVSGYPTTVFIDKDLNVSSVYPGLITKEKLIEKINR